MTRLSPPIKVALLDFDFFGPPPWLEVLSKKSSDKLFLRIPWIKPARLVEVVAVERSQFVPHAAGRGKRIPRVCLDFHQPKACFDADVALFAGIRAKEKITAGDLKKLLAQDRDLLKTIIEETLQQVLEADMDEALQASKSECTAGWKDLLAGLRQRSLHGVEFVVSDDHAGLLRTRLPRKCKQNFEFSCRSDGRSFDMFIEGGY